LPTGEGAEVAGLASLKKLQRFTPLFSGFALFTDYVSVYGKNPFCELIKAVVADLPLGVVHPEYPYSLTRTGIDGILKFPTLQPISRRIFANLTIPYCHPGATACPARAPVPGACGASHVPSLAESVPPPASSS
jgi:hypothetical protein